MITVLVLAACLAEFLFKLYIGDANITSILYCFNCFVTILINLISSKISDLSHISISPCSKSSQLRSWNIWHLFFQNDLNDLSVIKIVVAVADHSSCNAAFVSLLRQSSAHCIRTTYHM